MRIKKFRFLTLFVLALAFLGAGAFCQEKEDRDWKWAGKVGFYRPDSYAWRDASSGTPKGVWWWLGIDYLANRTDGGDCLVTYEHKLVSQELARMYALQGIYRHWAGSDEDGRQTWYYGAGVGLYFARVRRSGVWGSATRIGVPLVVGKKLGRRVFGEVKYHAVLQKARGISLSGFSVGFGYWF
jgi:hypothetical protein